MFCSNAIKALYGADYLRICDCRLTETNCIVQPADS